MNSQSIVNQGGRFTNVTPLPWRVSDIFKDSIWGANDTRAAKAIPDDQLEKPYWHVQDNAAFIVEAVNSYHAHLERIARLEGALQLVVNSGPLNNGMRDDNTMAEARAALKGD